MPSIHRSLSISAGVSTKPAAKRESSSTTGDTKSGDFSFVSNESFCKTEHFTKHHSSPFEFLHCCLLSVKCNFDRLSNHFGFCSCVCVCVSLSTDRLSNDYVRNSLPIFTKFCMPLRNVVVSNAIASRTNRK